MIPVLTGILGDNSSGLINYGPLYIPSLSSITPTNFPNNSTLSLSSAFLQYNNPSIVSSLTIGSGTYNNNWGQLDENSCVLGPLNIATRFLGPMGPLYLNQSLHNEVSSDSLTISETLARSKVNVRFLTDTLIFTDAANVITVHNTNISDTLVISELGRCITVHSASLTDSLIITDVALDQVIYVLSESLSITESEVNLVIHVTQNLFDTVIFSENLVGSNLYDFLSITEDLESVTYHNKSLSDTVTVFEHIQLQQFPKDQLILSDSASNIIVHNDNINDTLTITETDSELYVRLRPLNDTLTIVSVATFSGNFTIHNNDSLTINNTATFVHNKANFVTPSDTINFNEVVNLQFITGSNDSLFFEEEIGYAKAPGCCATLVYAPLIEPNLLTLNGTVVVPMRPLPPLNPFGGQFGVVYQSPFDSPIFNLNLPAPKFGDKDLYATPKIIRNTRGGTNKNFRAPTWNKYHNVEYSFPLLCEEQYYATLQFLSDSLGQQIKLFDFEGRTWKGIIINPNSALTQNGRFDYSATIQLQGDLIAW